MIPPVRLAPGGRPRAVGGGYAECAGGDRGKSARGWVVKRCFPIQKTVVCRQSTGNSNLIIGTDVKLNNYG
jgi:hypothetical protein